ncbi:hypothetical protein HPB47_008605 [Ixodes persulcatus]|uniref:Uncharacterized protein n=1 Tax=Ixodes persulcatus TaxID=34615 RepID=A0AC60P4E9_IXOPE|nr:hypothetical protein HPB47_008605 [Ixodes persulcatus]
MNTADIGWEELIKVKKLPIIAMFLSGEETTSIISCATKIQLCCSIFKLSHLNVSIPCFKGMCLRRLVPCQRSLISFLHPYAELLVQDRFQ